ncbi:hypothetical protein RDWZM_005445 [Blomia tropicalis]|uniref:Uncharacterized protein n=1 Tax=Blomia tropicalis TaxID=40697 RepID=A0A9Q0M422_BLOTA|nr:hypothetical protein RDWZM_005445 [Blomia tropicalis]
MHNNERIRNKMRKKSLCSIGNRKHFRFDRILVFDLPFRTTTSMFHHSVFFLLVHCSTIDDKMDEGPSSLGRHHHHSK